MAQASRLKVAARSSTSRLRLRPTKRQRRYRCEPCRCFRILPTASTPAIVQLPIRSSRLWTTKLWRSSLNRQPHSRNRSIRQSFSTTGPRAISTRNLVTLFRSNTISGTKTAASKQRKLTLSCRLWCRSPALPRIAISFLNIRALPSHQTCRIGIRLSRSISVESESRMKIIGTSIALRQKHSFRFPRARISGKAASANSPQFASNRWTINSRRMWSTSSVPLC